MGIVLYVTIFKGQFNCHGTIGGYDYYELSSNREAAIAKMVDNCKKFAPGVPYRIEDKTVTASSKTD